MPFGTHCSVSAWAEGREYGGAHGPLPDDRRDKALKVFLYKTRLQIDTVNVIGMRGFHCSLLLSW